MTVIQNARTAAKWAGITYTDQGNLPLDPMKLGKPKKFLSGIQDTTTIRSE